MNRSIVVAVIQMVSGPRCQDNLAVARQRVAEAAAAGAELIVLPEYFGLMGLDEHEKVRNAELAGNGPMQAALASMAHEHGVWLLGGTVPLVSEVAGKVYNSACLFDPQGQCLIRYDKIHLFGFTGTGERYCESDTIAPGNTPVVVDTPLGRIALGICYDLRFPELFRQLAPFDLLLLPAAFTATTGQAHWEVLLRARAIENQCFVLASAQGGQHENGRLTHGHAMIIDPWGRILAQQATDEGVVLATLDYNLMQSVRTSLPALAHRVLK